MNKTLLLLLLIVFPFINCLKSQRLSDCKVDAWEGRKTNFQISKIAVYTGDDKNAPIEFYDDFSKKTQVWGRRSDGVYCLVDTMLYDIIYKVTDTIKCRDFIVRYCVSYKNLVTKGTKMKVTGICPNKITAKFKKELIAKLEAEDVLYEIPDENVPNWEHVWYMAIMNYQQKYGLNVGLLTLETVKHMKLVY